VRVLEGEQLGAEDAVMVVDGLVDLQEESRKSERTAKNRKR